uniref:Polygalacturonase n=1 Tax=Oryza brachyantha TaxID=4533 RepID=J3MJQ2_ORYBR
MYGTTNGARIKTWQGGKGSAKNIVFQNIIMDNVWNPIIIDQNYCDSSTPCKQQKSALEVSNVLFKNIRGTSASEKAIMLHCSSSVPCHAITLESVKLTVKGGSSDAKSTCQNAKWKESDMVHQIRKHEMSRLILLRVEIGIIFPLYQWKNSIDLNDIAYCFQQSIKKVIQRRNREFAGGRHRQLLCVLEKTTTRSAQVLKKPNQIEAKRRD